MFKRSKPGEGARASLRTRAGNGLTRAERRVGGVRGFSGEGKLLTTAGRAVRVNDKSAEEAWKIYDSRQVKLRC